MHISTALAEKMPKLCSTLAKPTAGTLSFDQPEAVRMLKTQPQATYKKIIIETITGEERMPDDHVSTRRIFQTKTQYRSKDTSLLEC